MQTTETDEYPLPTKAWWIYMLHRCIALQVSIWTCCLTTMMVANMPNCWLCLCRFVIKKSNKIMKSVKTQKKIRKWNQISNVIMNASFATNRRTAFTSTSTTNSQNDNNRSPCEIETVCSAHASTWNWHQLERHYGGGYENCGMSNHKTEQATGKFNWFKITLFTTHNSNAWAWAWARARARASSCMYACVYICVSLCFLRTHNATFKWFPLNREWNANGASGRHSANKKKAIEMGNAMFGKWKKKSKQNEENERHRN